jgi:hypothetical protein
MVVVGVVLHIFLGGYCCYAARIGIEKSHHLKSSVVGDSIQCFSFLNSFFGLGVLQAGAYLQPDITLHCVST